jgi:hypothetical protein
MPNPFDDILKDMAEAPARIARAKDKATIEVLKHALEEIRATAHVCRIQRLPSDDRIIAEHIDEIHTAAKHALDTVKLL